MILKIDKGHFEFHPAVVNPISFLGVLHNKYWVWTLKLWEEGQQKHLQKQKQRQKQKEPPKHEEEKKKDFQFLLGTKILWHVKTKTKLTNKINTQ